MRVLVLGGTGFVGRAIAAALRSDGAAVTLFHRSPGPGSTDLAGDRDTGDYTALAGRAWDAVVDVSGYLPRHVGEAMDALGEHAGRYLFISSHAVFDGGSTARRALRRDAVLPLTDATYGPAKVACEDDILARYGDRATIVRPGKVAGPHDNQDGLTYWVRRAARGGPIAVPGRPDQPVQVVDARDLAILVVHLLLDNRPGAFTAVGPTTSLGALIHLCATAAGTTVELVPVPLDSAPQPFPLVKPEPAWHTQRRDPGPARAAGLPVTPLEVTVTDVLAWDTDRGRPPLSRGFTEADEARLLGAAR
ncbi:NAD-dependent epimerase/dehydratase family protein [Jidongwangia harbinensis]|uniref:NAD-dependent epimerase/dehydratase family protein n=1 Tax=Jidongwangia harbinensis TaxID=2878561 RepID=UPI001CDA2D28|nr:NAD-dependent epimerase/dehydratase family protein [Jidongwangia harbinensis]MCA2214779.1 NAD-dependent epimerase/dehydratase family protein [Jidongwangia harbinensis]